MNLFGHSHHRNDRPWDEAPDWAIELREISLITMEMIMAIDLTKLQAGATAAEATIAAQRTEIADLKTQLAAAQSAAENPADQTAIDQVGDQLTAAAATPPA